MKRLKKILSKKQRLCVGLMSGTSMDGVDATLVKITGAGINSSIEVIDWIEYPFPPGIYKRLLSYIAADSIPLSEVSRINFLLGELFAESVLELLAKCGYKPEDVDLIGSHGQTVWHSPGAERGSRHSTLQLGEPAVIQAKTGIITVADFRTKDVALGGEGAPLIPYFDYIVLRSDTEDRAALNLGGIANITVLPAGGSVHVVYAFDTGPGNMIIDQLMSRMFNRKSDTRGRTAAQADPHKELLKLMMQHPFIEKAPPKSTGREIFGAGFANHVLSRANEFDCTETEIISTAAEFTVQSITKNIELFVKPKHPLKRLIISGGGVHNDELVRRLRESLKPVEIEPIDMYGIPANCKEAAAFALFANETVSGNPVNLPAVTGAKKAAISGKIIL